MGALLRSKLWIAVGLIVVASLLLFLLGAMPLMRSNNELLRTLNSRAEGLELSTQAGAKNQQWIDQQKEIAGQMQQQLRAIEARLLERDALLERRFSDPETGREGPLEYGRWMFVYKDNMAALQEKLEKSVVVVTASEPIVKVSLGLVWLGVDEMHRLEKQYWIQEAIVDAIAELNAADKVVPVFGGFRFVGGPERYMSPSHMVNFACAAFSLDVAMEPKFLPAFLCKLLEAPDERAPLGIEITSVSISRQGAVVQREARQGAMRPLGYGYIPAGMEGMPGMPSGVGPAFGEERAPEPETTEALPDKMVSVHVLGYVPDYVQPQEKKPAAKLSGTEPASGGRQSQP